MEKFEKAYPNLIKDIEKRYEIELTDAEKGVIKQCLIHSQRKSNKGKLTNIIGDFQKKSAEYMWLRQYKIYTPDLDKCEPDSSYYEFVRKTREKYILP